MIDILQAIAQIWLSKFDAQRPSIRDKETMTQEKAWQRVLSSIATSEGMEALVLDPLLQVFQDQNGIYLSLHRHADDEKRHSLWLVEHLRTHYGYVKEGRTLSDVLFYSFLLKRLQAKIVQCPLLGLSILYTYEIFAMILYRTLRSRAHASGRTDLEHIFTEILKDEVRHIKGLQELSQVLLVEKPLTKVERVKISLWLKIMSFDVNMGQWALHNRELRQCFLLLGVAPKQLVYAIRQALLQTNALLSARSH